MNFTDPEYLLYADARTLYEALAYSHQPFHWDVRVKAACEALAARLKAYPDDVKRRYEFEVGASDGARSAER